MQNKDLKVVKKTNPYKQQPSDQSQIEDVPELSSNQKLNAKAVKVLLNEEALAVTIQQLRE